MQLKLLTNSRMREQFKTTFMSKDRFTRMGIQAFKGNRELMEVIDCDKSERSMKCRWQHTRVDTQELVPDMITLLVVCSYCTWPSRSTNIWKTTRQSRTRSFLPKNAMGSTPANLNRTYNISLFSAISRAGKCTYRPWRTSPAAKMYKASCL